MTIDPNDPRITAYVFGELEGEALSEFEQQLRESAELSKLVAQTRTAIDLIGTDLGELPPVRLSEQQRQNVHAQIAGASTAASMTSAPPLKPAGAPPPPTGPGAMPGWMFGAALAATLLLLVGGGSMFFWVAAPRMVADSSVPRQSTRATDDVEYDAMPLEMMAEPDGADMANATAGAAAPMPMAERADYSAEGLIAPSSAAPMLGNSGSPIAEGAKRMRQAPAAEAPTVLPAAEPDATRGPEDATPGGGQFAPIQENDFQRVAAQPLSTFSIDVDTAAYAKVRQLLNNGTMPPPDAVRLEELVNYFPYGYEGPASDSDTPFAAHLAVSGCPWNPKHRLVRIGIKGYEVDQEARPAANVVFLVDVSGSMQRPNRLPLLKRGLVMLAEQLRADDRVALVAYASDAGVVLESTPGSQREQIIEAVQALQSGGSTNGAAGIHLAYQLAMDHFIQDGINRVILCSDGDFNVGTSDTEELAKLAEEKAKSKVYLSVLGFGMGNHNDAMLEEISNRGNGNYAFIDTDAEARKVLVDGMLGTLLTIAKDVKIQVDFNWEQVAAYRMLGYENRRLRNRDFADDTKDAGEIGSGHTVTMLYEIIPADEDTPQPPKRKKGAESRYAEGGDDLLTLAMRYKQPDQDKSSLVEFPLKASAEVKFGQADRDFRFAAAVASFGMLLRNSAHRGDTSYDAVLEIAAEAAGTDPLRLDLLTLIRQAQALAR
ncbi:MAG: VWA domain-containing protein [Planctomycetales bacterium]|nr:VWA domain-containing protein [Planctomycetales bacterium]